MSRGINCALVFIESTFVLRQWTLVWGERCCQAASLRVGPRVDDLVANSTLPAWTPSRSARGMGVRLGSN